MLIIKTQEIVDALRNFKSTQVKHLQHNIEFELWNVNDLEHLNKEYCVDEFLPNYLAIGSSGGGEMLTVELVTSKCYSIPFIPMQASDRLEIAKSLKGLSSLLVL